MKAKTFMRLPKGTVLIYEAFGILQLEIKTSYNTTLIINDINFIPGYNDSTDRYCLMHEITDEKTMHYRKAPKEIQDLYWKL